MHKEILSPAQTELLPLIKSFKREFYLVGGTAIALHIGHRRAQLCFFSDIDYSEPVEFIVPAVAEAEIREMLEEKAIELET